MSFHLHHPRDLFAGGEFRKSSREQAASVADTHDPGGDNDDQYRARVLIDLIVVLSSSATYCVIESQPLNKFLLTFFLEVPV